MCLVDLLFITNRLHPTEAFAIDAFTLHTIKLIQYSRKLRSMIISAQQQIESLVRLIYNSLGVRSSWAMNLGFTCMYV